jgi:hypothetical protein
MIIPRQQESINVTELEFAVSILSIILRIC